MSKRAALELSIGTIVIIVIAVTMLILGLVLVKTIMCGALLTSVDLTNKMKDQINKLFQDTGSDVILLKGPGGILSIPPGERSGIWFAFKPNDVATKYDYEFSVALDDRFKRSPYNIRESDVESWIIGSRGSDNVGVNNVKEKNLIIQPPANTPNIIFTLKLKVNNQDREEVHIEVKKQTWAYRSFC